MIVESDNQILRQLTRHTPEEIEAYEEEKRQEALREWRNLIASREEAYNNVVGIADRAKLEWLAQFQTYGRAKGYKPGWAHYKYKDKFGAWPTFVQQVDAGYQATVTQELKDYITHTIIKAAKDAKRNSRQAG